MKSEKNVCNETDDMKVTYNNVNTACSPSHTTVHYQYIGIIIFCIDS